MVSFSIFFDGYNTDEIAAVLVLLEQILGEELTIVKVKQHDKPVSRARRQDTAPRGT